ncbi:hypothetical protein ZWY2020_012040 [Hordeum vulgare]|nr:hypothetical protein ZWY2020_012040 [Hordeum vulgare]
MRDMAPGGKRRKARPATSDARSAETQWVDPTCRACNQSLTARSHGHFRRRRGVAKGQIYVPGPRIFTHAGHAALFPDLDTTPSRAPSSRLPIRRHGSVLTGLRQRLAQRIAVGKRTEISTPGASMGTNPSQKIPSTPQIGCGGATVAPATRRYPQPVVLLPCINAAGEPELTTNPLVKYSSTVHSSSSSLNSCSAVLASDSPSSPSSMALQLLPSTLSVPKKGSSMGAVAVKDTAAFLGVSSKAKKASLAVRTQVATAPSPVTTSPGSTASSPSGKKTLRQGVVVITGASSGLGLAAAKALAETGKWHVVMACRDFKASKAAGGGHGGRQLHRHAPRPRLPRQRPAVR